MFFLHLWQDKLQWVELRGSNIYYYITTLSLFVSLETASTQKSEAFLLRISSGNMNTSVVTYQYPQIYNFSFKKEFLETLCKCYLEF